MSGGGPWVVFSVSGKINKGKEENDNKIINLKYYNKNDNKNDNVEL